MKLSLPAVLSLTGGYADTTGYLALGGLFTAHVTGNFVTLGSSLVFGTSGALSKLLALPVFCAAVILARLLAHRLRVGNRPALRTLLSLQALLLLICAWLAVGLGPVDNADAWPALLLGMTLVAAMAIQNAAHRVYLPSAPPSTIMTGTTTQMMLDVADILHGLPPQVQAATRARLKKMTISVLVFATGCGLGALLYAWVHVWCFCLTPALVLLALTTPQAVEAAAA